MEQDIVHTDIKANYTTPSHRKRRITLHNVVVDEMRHDILEGKLKPGSKIPEVALCAKFDISRTPLREALKVLASEGLVELLPNRGAVVRKYSSKDVKDLFELMPPIEGLIGRLAIKHATEEDISNIEYLHERMLDFHQRKRRSDYFRVNQQIHMALAQATGNKALVEEYERLSSKIIHARYLANTDQSRWDESADEHIHIMQALKARDEERLSELLSIHVSKTGESVVVALQKQAPEEQR
ncbi:GntR family transcriptional regulator [Acidihalobacter ferrooxydans]|uniref:HTH gntR-type domain-containing protein n=1 Tax=Acidihalobacter ferrooxydans TaxID=1765967 RepID=A0A1P8ULI5_9GAMM|nr:GntR family transcriptional regulator [Acidihalobacter ferrooxydans]APZ44698.1 hypothetical protein BW247_12065 [Acidihalobacter ferrooxydans]